jgi:hypothetical protein
MNAKSSIFAAAAALLLSSVAIGSATVPAMAANPVQAVLNA